MGSFKLRRGITGIFESAELVPPAIPFGEFRSVVQRLATATGLRVQDATSAGVTPNFHHATLVSSDESVAILCNHTQRVVAFAVAPISYQQLTFVDRAYLAGKLAEMWPCEIVASEELEREPAHADITDLAPCEQRYAADQITRRVGDFVYNWWD